MEKNSLAAAFARAVRYTFHRVRSKALYIIAGLTGVQPILDNTDISPVITANSSTFLPASPPAPAPSPQSSPPTSAPIVPSSKSSLSGGAIGGIVAGAILGVLLIAGKLFAHGSLPMISTVDESKQCTAEDSSDVLN